MTTQFSQSNNATLDTAIASASLNAFGGSGSYVLGASINNTPTNGTTVSYDLADLTITLSSAITLGTGNVYLSVYILPAIDGANYASPNSAAAAPANLLVGTYTGVPSASVTTLVVTNLPIPSCPFKVLLQNNLGVPFPSTNTSTAQLQRRTLANW